MNFLKRLWGRTIAKAAPAKKNRELLVSNDGQVRVRIHDEVFGGQATGDQFKYDSYEDWRRVQFLKGDPDWFERIWENNKEKQIRNWTFASIKPGERILEVGFRDGFNLKYLEDMGLEVSGIEVNEEAVRAAKENGSDVHIADIQKETPFADGTFDIISACDVLEHCFDPKGAFREMHRVLKDDGRIVIEIPFESEFAENVTHGHCYLYHNAENVAALVSEAGLRVEKEDLSISTQNLFLLRKANAG